MRKLLLIACTALSCWIPLTSGNVSTLSGTSETSPEDGWKIVASQYPDDYTGVPVANGTLGLLPWKEPFSVKHIMLNNVSERLGDDMVNCSVRGINPFGLTMKIGDCVVSEDCISEWTQTIDMRRAEHVTEFVAAGKVRVRYSFVALRNLPYSMLMNVEMTALEDVALQFSNSVSAPEEYRCHDSYRKSWWIEDRWLHTLRTDAQTLHGRYDVAAASAFLHDGWLVRKSGEYGSAGVADSGAGLAEGVSDVYEAVLAKGETKTFSIAASVCSTADFSDPYNEAVRQLVFIDRMGVPLIMEGHRKAWEELWQGDIEIEGDMEAQHAVRLAFFNLYGFCREGSGLSISPMGLSSRGYNGHIFWDTEMWMYPPMLMMNQGIAKSMMDYRADRLEQARKRAAASGYRGAMFPWESDSSGEESTPVWALTGPMEHHVTADVAIAAWNYWCVTRDREWLESEGWPMIRSAAEFWESRVVKNDDGSYSISGVVGADEYAQNVTDNAFTNGAAAVALRCAVKAARECGVRAPALWSEIADGLRILEQDGITLEYEGYDGRMIKQADANLLGYPLCVIKDNGRLLQDLEYYESRMDPVNGPAMSFSIFCVQYARMGMADKAEEMFRRSYRPNSRPPFGALAETPASSNPYFATAAGGLLQAVINGFGGLEITDGGIVRRKSVLPPSWKKLTIRGIGPEKRTYIYEKSHKTFAD